MRAYDGDITVQSQPGQGTTFIITLHLAQPTAPPPDLLQAMTGAKVLMVEDEAMVAMGGHALLEEAGATRCGSPAT